MRNQTPNLTFSVKLANWFEANATGWAVVLIPLTLLIGLAVAAAVAVLR